LSSQTIIQKQSTQLAIEWTLIIGARKFFIASWGVVYSMIVGERRALSTPR